MTPAIDKLRAMVRYFNNTNESLNMSLTFAELVKVFDAYRASEYDYTPDQWTPQMLKAAIKGKPIDPLMPERLK